MAITCWLLGVLLESAKTAVVLRTAARVGDFVVASEDRSWVRPLRYYIIPVCCWWRVSAIFLWTVRVFVFLAVVLLVLIMDLVFFNCVDFVYKACLEVRVVRKPDPDESSCLAWTKLGTFCTKARASVPLGRYITHKVNVVF